MRIRDLIPWGHRHHEAVSQTPAQPALDLQHELRRLVEEFWHPDAAGGRLPAAFGQGLPATDLVETEDAVEFSIELPGLDDDDLEVTITDDALTVKGEKRIERQDDAKGWWLSERQYGVVQRTIPMPAGLDPHHARARLGQGVLTVTVPRSEAGRASRRRIEVEKA